MFDFSELQDLLEETQEIENEVKEEPKQEE